MRVISQDGTIDVPYELTSIQLVSKTTIIAQGSYFGSSSDDNYVTVAEYSTEEKAQKALKMLQNDYYDHIAEKTYHEGTYYIRPYFRFPKDEEVEV